MNVLVDTSVWSLALRRKPASRNAAEDALVTELSALIGEGRARILGFIRQELLSGIRSTDQFEKLRIHLRAFPDEPIETKDYEEAAKAGNLCRSKGIATSLVDLLLCAVAIRRRYSIFSADPDFTTYARALPLALHTPRA